MKSCQFIVLVLGLAVAVLANVQVRKIGKKIVGGMSARITDVPYQVSVNLDGWITCGGTIIHPSWVLTAAHCVTKGTASNYTIRAGTSVHFFSGELVEVSKIIRHPLFDENIKSMCDLALLKLKIPLKTSKYIWPIPLTKAGPKVGDLIVISGWGAEEETGYFSSTLQVTSVPVLSREKCILVYNNIRYIPEYMFCAGYYLGGKDACKGDSGGPAVFNGRLVGIVSWGWGCGRRNAPGVYMNVTMMVPWILSQIS